MYLRVGRMPVLHFGNISIMAFETASSASGLVAPASIAVFTSSRYVPLKNSSNPAGAADRDAISGEMACAALWFVSGTRPPPSDRCRQRLHGTRCTKSRNAREREEPGPRFFELATDGRPAASPATEERST